MIMLHFSHLAKEIQSLLHQIVNFFEAKLNFPKTLYFHASCLLNSHPKDTPQ